MHDDHLRSFRRYSRVFPTTAYARHTPRVGCSVATDARSIPCTSPSNSANRTSSVKILALLCSKVSPHSFNADTTPEKCSTMLALAQPLAVPRKRAREECVDDGDASASTRASTVLPEPPCRFEGKRKGSHSDGLSAPSESSDPPTAVASSAAVELETEARAIVTNAAEGSAAAAASCDTVEPAPTATLYVRVQYDKSLITTLPIEVMRAQHPQVLIDYLLAMSVWA
ncbi:conserved hypothetical protein [Leishmania braziliensis MHOM/BR/75/M2904]|uniref:Uncharacterized protein n=2 Tax=Leishmania braziliensis TaxID=5660 RepID=A4HGW0_LEIBR|nr:conserved hypothetical protein [Leishmania braziliensis MHOM/BR/75/M2904]KAI5685899.1 hypothetical protein MNV84_05402 [Leishmania braziliensis]CAJ2476079.1 unnamed protein product [Leishmania braziliensis]CAJ2476573.1 unnamed protein product [Leishmania braziliensis]CAM39808.1 conserved hypothetical protein [Leishmania braziliensis MHOM/BR/75/M2904]SYZ67465.1 hypothetical_protein [Leishmania braziliensis MHOM/BR/75/M2904]